MNTELHQHQSIGTAENNQTSVAEKEIIPIPTNPSLRLAISNFSIVCHADCHISINGGLYFFISAGSGWNESSIVNSCKIKENGISFNWGGLIANYGRVEINTEDLR